jgi:hypothetical protein
MKSFGSFRCDIKKNYLLIILILINLLIGIIVASDYGESWDENNMRSYAELTIKAYQYFFQPEKMDTYYETLDDRKYYGPAYLMVGNAFVDFVNTQMQINRDSLYHFYNFLTFQLGVFFFYLLNRRFFSSVVAFVNTLIFNFQPVLFGHSFINAKDIAIMVFFMGAVEVGLRLVDAIPPLENKPTESKLLKELSWKPDISVVMKAITSEKKLILFSIIIICLLVALSSFGVFRNLIAIFFNIADNTPNSFLGNLFNKLAQNRVSIPLESYIQKGTIFVNRANLLIIGLIAMNILIRFFSKVFKQQFESVINSSRKAKRENWGRFRSLFNSEKSFYLSIRQVTNAFWETSRIWQLWLAAGLLGIISSIRLNGPYVGILVSLLLIMKNRKKALQVIILYGVISIIVMYVFWPYLWSAPIAKFYEAISYMANFPWNETVLFEGARYKANFIPTNYLPKLMLAQFTETTIFLVLLGILIAAKQMFNKQINYLAWYLLIFWSLLPLSITIFSHMRIYDNFRHIFFLIPPLFIFGGFSIDFFYQKLKKPLFIILVIALVFPGIYSNFKMHPYEYVYYNSTIGGLDGAIDKYELDYLGTSLKEATEFVNQIAPYGSTVYIYAPLHLVSTYARADLILTNSMKEKVPNTTGFTVNLNRFYWSNKIFPDDKDLFYIKRGNAVFAIVREVQ